jgi:hypothetical protein
LGERDRHYPEVWLETGRVLASAGGRQLITSGGASSWEDLTLHLVARPVGGREAVRIAKMRCHRAPAGHHEDAAIARAEAWIADHYGVANPGDTDGRALRASRAHLQAPLQDGDRPDPDRAYADPAGR